ncbi:MAG TPA: hypothetical protein VL856_02625 [Acidimicrobiia bacterium]|nr:hypothetical protein [Acidimicrobiia bacterium]
MARLTYAISLFTIFVAAAACGSNSSSTPDALVCTAPDMQCVTGTCTNTNTDEQNCGTCGNVCKGGAYCKAQPDGCTCPNPENFIGTDVPASSLLDFFFSQQMIHVGFGGVTGTAQLNALGVIVSQNSAFGITMVDTDYTLKEGVTSIPAALAAYNVSVGGGQPTFDALYQATSGTIRFDTITCAGGKAELKGTITDAHFQGVKGTLPNIQVDPNGCFFDVAKLTFDITGDDSGCP